MRGHRPNRLPEPYEHQEQHALAAWLDMIGVRWCHVPNGEPRDKRTAAKLKRLGVKPGVPDILIFTPPPRHPRARGVAIELKRRLGGDPTSNQRKWITALDACGWKVAVRHGVQEAVEWLRELGYGK